MSELTQSDQVNENQNQSNSTQDEKEQIQLNQKREDKVGDQEQQDEGEGEEEEYEDEEEEFEMADFSKVEKAEKLIKHIMKDKELEYRFLLEIKSKNYDEAEFMAAKILAKDPNNEIFLLFWDMLRKYKQEFYQIDEEELQAEEEEAEEEEEEWDEEEEVDEYDYNDGEEYEDEYEVEDDEDGWKTEDEYDTDELEEEDEEEDDEQVEEDNDEEEELEASEEEEEEEQENYEETQNEQKDQVENTNLESQQLKKPVIKKKERNAKTELIQPFVQKQEIQSSNIKQDSKSISGAQKLGLKYSDIKSTSKQQIVLTKEVKPPLKPISSKQAGIKSQSISSAFEIKSKTTQLIPTTAALMNNAKRPPSSSSIQSQNNNNSNRPPSSSSIKSANNQNSSNRPPSSSSIQSAKETTHKRNNSQSARDKKIPSLSSLGSDIQKLPPINNNLPTLGENKKSISSISSASTQITTQKRASSRDYRASKSISTTTNYK